uniref:PAW domain-containing protein n=1 Tax=Ciona savignyi TaxID=51511 RepID=H2ZBE2_CIOSA
MFNSGWLKSIILELNEAKRLSLSLSKKDLLTKRMLNEEKELSFIKLLPDEDLGGRTSGSLTWRTARGETEGEKRKTLVENFKAIKSTDVELKNGKIHIEYSCSSDKYTRISDSKTSHGGWKTFVFRVQDVMRKVEYDWKRAYLCRKEKSLMGYIAWQIELPKTYAISVAEIFVADTIFEDGFVKWLVTTDKTSRSIKSGSSEKLELLNTKSRVLSIHAFLRGENWQHSQIFREATGSPSSPSLKLQIEFTRI